MTTIPSLPFSGQQLRDTLAALDGAIDGKAAVDDARLSDAREWSATTISQAEAEAGTATTRRAFTAQRVLQAVAAWWAASAAKTKLDGIASGATANASDAALLSRANHTGSQAASTISGLAAVATSGSYGDLSGRPTLGSAAALSVGTTANTVAAGDDARLNCDAPFLALGDEITAATAGTKVTLHHWPIAHRLTAIPLWSSSAPVGSALQLDIRVSGTSIFSTLPTIAVGGVSSTATTAAVFSTAFVSSNQTITAGSVVTFHVTQAPSGGGGAGLKVFMPAVRV